jgi:hypothetical protein
MRVKATDILIKNRLKSDKYICSQNTDLKEKNFDFMALPPFGISSG